MSTRIWLLLALLITGWAVWFLLSQSDAPVEVESDASSAAIAVRSGTTEPVSAIAPAPFKPAVSAMPPVARRDTPDAAHVAVSSATGDRAATEAPAGGGVDIILQCDGERMGGAVEVFTHAETVWPWPVDRRGEDPPRMTENYLIMGDYRVSIPAFTRYRGSNGHCLVPCQGRVAVSLAVVVEGFEIQTFNRVGLAPGGEEPKQLVVEVGGRAVTSLMGRVVDEAGRAVPSATVTWTATGFNAGWELEPRLGAMQPSAGDQLRLNLKVAGATNADGKFEIAPVLPSETGSVRVFLGDLLVATRKNVLTEFGSKTTLGDIEVPTSRMVTVRLDVCGQWAERFQVHIKGGITAMDELIRPRGTSIARSNRSGEVRMAVRDAQPLIITPGLDSLGGPLALGPINLSFSVLLSYARDLAYKALSAHELRVERGSELGNEVIIQLTRDKLDAACADPANATLLEGLRLALAKERTAPKELLDAAQSVIDKQEMLPLMRLLLEAQN